MLATSVSCGRRSLIALCRTGCCGQHDLSLRFCENEHDDTRSRGEKSFFQRLKYNEFSFLFELDGLLIRIARYLWHVFTMQRLGSHSDHCTLPFPDEHVLKALSHEAICSCNLQRNGVSSCLFTREIASCNTSSLQNNPTAGHTTTCICLQFHRSLKYLFRPNLLCKLREKIASCDSAFKASFHLGKRSSGQERTGKFPLC